MVRKPAIALHLFLMFLVLATNLSTVLVGTPSAGDLDLVRNPRAATNAMHSPLVLNSVTIYYLNLTTTTGGTTSPAPGLIPEASGSNVLVTASPFPHYAIDHWSLDGSAISGSSIPVAMYSNRTLQVFFSSLLNQPPLLWVPGPQTVDEGALLAFVINATDADDLTETISLSASGLPAASTFDPAAGTFSTGNPVSGLFSWLPREGQGPADYLIIFTATDNGVPALSDTRPVAVHVNEANLPPSLAVPGHRTINLQTNLNFTVAASDPDNPPENLTLSATSLPYGATFITSTGVFTWTPTIAQAGNYTVTFHVSDGSLTAAKSVLITVNGLNQPPVLSVPGTQTIDPGTLLQFTIITTDPDLPPETLTLSAMGLPPGAAFDPATGMFSWRPAQAEGPGVYVIAFTSDDGHGGTVTHRVTVNVNKPVSSVVSLTAVSGLGPLWYLAIGLLVVDILILQRARRKHTTHDQELPRSRSS